MSSMNYARPVCRTWDFHANCWRVTGGAAIEFPDSGGFRVVIGGIGGEKIIVNAGTGELRLGHAQVDA